jgi:hypothetical protein
MTTLADKPAWLSAWREANPERAAEGDAAGAAAQAAADARNVARSEGARRPRGKHPKMARLPKAVSQWGQGFSEPEPWDFDGCKRREAVLDHDHNPPRVVRHVGWRVCLKCEAPFFSEDVTRLRMCGGCKTEGQKRDPAKPPRQ